MKKIDKTNHFLGYKILSTTKEQVLNTLFSQVESGTDTKIVFTPNPEQLVMAKSYSSFGKILGKADFLLPDGIGIVIASQILTLFSKNQPVLERITGVDVVSGLLEQFPGKRILIIGGRGYQGSFYKKWQVVEAVLKNGRNKKAIGAGTEKRSVLYWHEGFLNVSQPTVAEKESILQILTKLQPEIVFVALGAPYQEQWIIENYATLQASGVKLAMVVGGAFDMLFRKVKRAPKWMQKSGLEWLFRLSQEPWRWRRQLNLVLFVKMVAQEALR